MQQAADELEYLVMFNRSISQAMTRTKQDLSEGVFINMANLTLAQLLGYLHAGVKHRTLSLHYILLLFIFSHFSRTNFLSKLRKRFLEVRRGVLLASHTGNQGPYSRKVLAKSQA